MGSAFRANHLLDDLQPQTVSPATHPDTVLQQEHLRTGIVKTEHTSSHMQPRKAKRKAPDTCVDVAGYFEELDRMYNEEDRDDPEQHNPDFETIPSLQQYMPSFLQAENKASDIVQRISRHVADEPEQDSESLYMHERLIAIERPAYPPPLRIAISGNSGIGKSTMINATLAVPTLCPTSDNDAGTLVPMELVHSPSDQMTKYAFYVDLFPLENCIKIVKWAVKEYFNSCVTEEDDSMELQDADRGGAALKVLLALFSDTTEFGDSETAAEFLGKLESPEDPYALSMMLGWTNEIHGKLSAHISKGPMSACTAEELADMVEPYIQTSETPMIQLDDDVYLESCVWPFVRLARISFAHPILAKNIIFADLPGLTDTNTHRVRATRQYLRKCDFIIVAHTNTRAGDDPGFKKNVKMCQKLKRNGNVAVVITQSDKVANTKAARIPYTLDEQGRLSSIDEHMQLIKIELKKAQISLKAASRPKDPGSGLTEQLRHKEGLYKLHLKHAENLKKQIAVIARNRQVTTELQSFYRRETKDSNDLRVFCVSSEQYLEHLQPHTLLEPPVLPLYITGIPDLRYFIQMLPSRSGRTDALVHHCMNVVPGVLNAITLSCTGFKPMMKREHLNKIILVTRENLPKHIRQARRDFWISHVVETVLNQIDMVEPAWLEKSEKLCNRWNKWNASGFHAFLRHEGAWRTAKCGRADWNQELLDIAEEHLRPTLDNLCDKSSNSLQEGLAQTLADLLDEMRCDIKGCLDTSQHGAFREFFENIQKQGKDFEVTLRQACKILASDIHHLVYNAMTNSESNPFAKKMTTVYALACHASPTKQNRTKHTARTHIFKASLLVPKLGPYREIKDYLERFIDVCLQEVESQLLKKCETVFNNIQHDFESICPRRADDTPGATKRRHGLGKVVEEAKYAFNIEVRAKLLECGLKLD